jgi:hypothetical protein
MHCAGGTSGHPSMEQHVGADWELWTGAEAWTRADDWKRRELAPTGAEA